MSLIPLGSIPRHFLEKRGADAVAVDFIHERLTWGQLEQRSTARAWAFQDAGVAKDDRVTVALGNEAAYFETLFALWKIGATPHVVSPRCPANELREILQLSRPKLLIGNVTASFEGVRVVPAEFGRHDKKVEPLPEVAASIWKAMSSGGSTGRPKIIQATGPSYFDTDAPDFLDMPKTGVVLSTSPLSHNMPLLVCMGALCRGLELIVLAKFDPEQTLNIIDKHRVTWAYFVPTMMMRISTLPEEIRRKYDVSSLEVVWHWAAPMPPELKREWIERFGADKIWELYGGTEAIATTIINGTEWLAHPGSVGRPWANDLRILGPDGEHLPPGSIGEIFSLPSTGQGSTYTYLGAEARSVADGYETLGDYGWLDDEGYLYIADRRTDMIVSGGSNVYPAEVEGALMAHPAIEAAVVIGLPDQDLGSAVHAIVKPTAGHEDEINLPDLQRFLRDRILPYKVPRSFEVVDFELRDDAGKVRRSALRDERLSEVERRHQETRGPQHQNRTGI